MPSSLTFPGVYIEEIPSGVRTIVGVATSITAFLGRALRGPTDQPVVINSYGDFERIFGGLWVNSYLGYAVRDFYQNGGSQAIIVRLHKGGTPGEIAADTLTLVATSVGAWGNSLAVTVDHKTKDPLNDKQFNLKIVELDPITQQAVRIETMLNVSVDPNDSRYVPLVLKDDSQLVDVKKDNNGNPSVPNARPAEVADVKATANSGADGDVLDQNAFTGGTNEADKKGLFALENADLFNILCIPPYKDNANVDTDLVSKAAAYCEKKRAMLLIDPPASWDTVAEVIGNPTATPPTGIATLGTSQNAAFFFPRLRQPNPLRENKLEDFVPCGAVAGVFARTDAQRGVWKAPAGLDATLVGVPQLTVSLTNEENGQLNPLGVNCLRTMPAAGRVVWGSRTRKGNDQLASEWKYVPVRRTALFIEESLYRALQWVVFEPNDEPLWAQIRLNVGAFMNSLFRQGAFQGQSPREAYFVKCDKDTTTQNDIDRGIVNILVGFAPLKPAEFVVIKLQQIAGQIQT
ncbi:MAG: phage tail sheath C-terminal domain-containing protein [Pyrinomonadaceae bacterium]